MSAVPYLEDIEAVSEITLGDIDDKGEINITDNMKEKDELLLELNSVTKTFAEIESSMEYKTQLYQETISTYEFKVSSLEEKNALLEKDLSSLTVTLENNEKKLQELQQDKNKMKDLQAENDMLRKRVRTLELQLSEVAFESRKNVVTPAFVTQKVEVNTKDSSRALPPKAPSTPVPPHIYQQRQLEHRQRVVRELEKQLRESKSPNGVPDMNKDSGLEVAEASSMNDDTRHLPATVGPSTLAPPHMFQQGQLLDQLLEQRQKRGQVSVLPSPQILKEDEVSNLDLKIAEESSINGEKYTPKAPSSPVPFQQRQLKQRERVLGARLEMKSRKGVVPALSAFAVPSMESGQGHLPPSRFKLASKSLESFVSSSINNKKHLSHKSRQEHLSIRKLFGKHIPRMVGRALHVWSPAYNLKLWTELMGQQHHQLEELQVYVEKYKYERDKSRRRERSRSKLFGLGFRRGRHKMGLFESHKDEVLPAAPAFVTPKRNAKKSSLDAVEGSNIHEPANILRNRQVESYNEEPSNEEPQVFGLSIRQKMGQALHKWSPSYNLGLYGELREERYPRTHGV